LRREPDGLESRAADFINRHGCNAHIEPAAQTCVPRWILPQARLDDVSHDDFVHRFRLNARAAYRFGNDFSAQLRRGKRGKSTLKFSDGRADCAQNDCLVHDATPRDDGPRLRPSRRQE
jgi:hypothetical protein